jgi:hypothetical protein
MADTERLQWHRSAHCDTNACVEVARRNGEVLVRDGKDPEGPWLTYSAGQWISFMDWLRRRRE